MLTQFKEDQENDEITIIRNMEKYIEIGIENAGKSSLKILNKYMNGRFYWSVPGKINANISTEASFSKAQVKYWRNALVNYQHSNHPIILVFKLIFNYEMAIRQAIH